ncbi:hypothetical protein SAMN05660199_03138 [Klenkia soli]|uniref:Uncharacterized protein n=1 Tax=Klenkia soli TaxID=1052260 RepID=A0A1H0PYF8_9ACTN|nr:hypothetical protein SAMN05660199_03138 [Klenkia soli]
MSAVVGAVGLGMLVAPAWTVRHLAPGQRAPRSWLVRVLGARTVVQSAVLLATPTRQALQVGAAVDALHAASMVPAALIWPSYRQVAAVSGGIATVSAALQLAVAPQSDDAVRIPGDVPAR